MACADPEGRFDEFNEKKSHVQAENDAGLQLDAEIDASNDANGQSVDAAVEAATDSSSTCELVTQGGLTQYYLLSISTKLIPKLPILTLVEFTISTQANPPTISIHAQPLDAKDRRTAVGDPIIGGPYPINSDGSFVADFGTITVPGKANPISGGDIVTTLILSAQAGGLCKPANFICGPVSGMLTAPIAGDLSGGSNFTFQAIVNEQEYPVPAIDCAKTLAP